MRFNTTTKKKIPEIDNSLEDGPTTNRKTTDKIGLLGFLIFLLFLSHSTYSAYKNRQSDRLLIPVDYYGKFSPYALGNQCGKGASSEYKFLLITEVEKVSNFKNPFTNTVCVKECPKRSHFANKQLDCFLNPAHLRYF
jgi:hypothetical protein